MRPKLACLAEKASTFQSVCVCFFFCFFFHCMSACALLSSIIPFKIYSRLSLSRIPRDSLKHFEISVPRHIRVAEVRKTKQ